MTLHSQSALLSLPGELKNEIYKLALSSNTAVTNPHHEPSTRPKHRHTPPLGAALSQTCREIHSELDTAALYKNNTFVFTRVLHVHAFYERLTRDQMRWIRSITIDLRDAAPRHQCEGATQCAENVSNEWLHYLACDHFAHAPGLWCARLSTLSSDIPDLKELVLDLTEWQSPFAGTRRGGWKYMQRLLGKIKGLESISLKGKCLDSKSWNPRPAPWSLAPWFSPAFCNDDISLLDLLGAGIRDAEKGEVKVFSWKLEDSVTTLQVRLSAPRALDALPELNLRGKVPENGMATWEAFLNVRNQQQGEQSSKHAQSNVTEVEVADDD